MQNDQNLEANKRLKKDKNFRKIVNWRIKDNFLKNQISVLEKTEEFPIFSISCFLLKMQLIEFELKQTITGLDLHLFFSNASPVLKITTRIPKKLDEKRLTLGRLRDEINEYEGSFLNDLKKHLSSLVTLRNEFVHGMFNLGGINELITKAEKGVRVASVVLKSIENVNNFLEENDPIKMKGGVGL